MKPRTIEIELEGSRYRWNGEHWTDSGYLTPPTRVRSLLMSRLITTLDETPARDLDARLVVAVARASEDQGHLDEARRLLERLLDAVPDDVDAVAQLASVLRKQRLPRQALRLTDDFTRRRHAGLLVERAAAFCDISEWDEAAALVRRVVAYEGRDASPETLRVMARVVAAQSRSA